MRILRALKLSAVKHRAQRKSRAGGHSLSCITDESFKKEFRMAVVAGLFDSEADATKAMDRLLREHFDDMDTRVINGSSRTSVDEPGVVIPMIPNTSGGPNAGVIGGPAAAGAYFGDWMSDMDEVERGFYSEAVREGSTLAMAKVDDKDADRVRQLFRSFGARTYMKDK